MHDPVILGGLAQAAPLTLWLTVLKVMATGVSLTLFAISAVFAMARRRPADRRAAVALCFALGNLFAAVYIGADAAVRLDVLRGELSGTLLSYRLALAASVLSIAAYVGLYWSLDGRRADAGRRTQRLFLAVAALAGLVFLEHPWLVIAGDRLSLSGGSAFADYGWGAIPFYGLTVALMVTVYLSLLRSPHRAADRRGWWLNAVGFGLLVATGLHDVARELGLRLLPFSILWLGYVGFQLGAFAFVGLHYARLLRERHAQEDVLRRLNEDLSRDMLTGLRNRSYLEQLLERRAAAGQPARGGLLFVDVDDFKRINDHHGHLIGDAVLQAVAAGLRAGLRDDDIACRWGGDEFLIYLPEADAAGVSLVADRLRAAVKELSIAGAPALSVRLSLGYAALGPEEGSWHDSLERADRALYASKAAGKNRLTVAAETAVG